MLNYFEEKKETFFDYKKEIFSKSKKSHFFFFKGVNPCFWSKNVIFLYLQLVKIRLDIMLSDFAEKEETCFDYKKTEFFKVQKNPLFQRKTHICFLPKNAIFSLVRFGHNKTRNNA